MSVYPPQFPQPKSPRAARRKPRGRLFLGLRASFLAGLVVIAPIGITVWLVWTLTGWMDSWVLPLIPQRLRPEHVIGIPLRGLGVIFFLLFTVLIGWAAKGWAGRALLRLSEQILDRMPVIGAIYGGLKQIAETVLAQGDDKFDRACLIAYPREGSWAVGFVAGPAREELAQWGRDHAEARLMAVFVPTTPNPTSGFLIFVPESEVIYLDMSVEEAAKLVISGGLVYPPLHQSAASE